MLQQYIHCFEHESGRVRCDNFQPDRLIGEALIDTNIIGRKCVLNLCRRRSREINNSWKKKNNEVGKNIDASGKLLNTKWFQTIQDVTT